MRRSTLLSLFLALVLGGLALAAQSGTRTAATETDLVADPYLEMSEITSATPEPETGLYCLCAYGINCCGDLPGNQCGLPWENCACSAGDCLYVG